MVWRKATDDDETDDEVSFSKTPRQLVLKIKSIPEDEYLTLTFIKEYENQGETNETI